MVSQAVHVAMTAMASFLATKYSPWILTHYATALSCLIIYVCSICIDWIYTVIIYPHFLSPLRKLPSPPGAHFLMGHSLQLLKQPQGLPHIAWLNTIPNSGLIYYRQTYNSPRITLTTPSALSEVLVTKSYLFTKPQRSRDFLGPIFGNGLVLAEGDEHKRQRKALMPAFSYRHVKDLYPIFWNEARKMCQGIAKEIGGEEKEVLVSDWVTRVTLDIIGRAGCGRSFNAIEDPRNALHQAYTRVFSPSFKPLPMWLNYSRLLIPLRVFRWLPIQQNRERNEAIEKIQEVAREIIRSKEKDDTVKDFDREAKDIISVARESGSFSEDNLVDQLITFLGAGHETTASSMMWATYLLCRHLEIQQRLRDEIRKTLPSMTSQDAAQMSDTLFDKMPYLNAVCNEIFRLYPPVPFIVREASNDTTISNHPIPRGTNIMLPIWAINNNISLWGSDAGSFDPERWLAPGQTNSGGAESNFANMTFLHGPRSCIGQAFAKSEFRCLLAALVGRFELRPVPGEGQLKIEGDLANKPKGGTRALMREVEGW